MVVHGKSNSTPWWTTATTQNWIPGGQQPHEIQFRVVRSNHPELYSRWSSTTKNSILGGQLPLKIQFCYHSKYNVGRSATTWIQFWVDWRDHLNLCLSMRIWTHLGGHWGTWKWIPGGHWDTRNSIPSIYMSVYIWVIWYKGHLKVIRKKLCSTLGPRHKISISQCLSFFAMKKYIFVTYL